MLRTRIKDFKLLTDVEAEFENGNLYFIQAGNKKGKTSFGQAILTTLNALNKAAKPITFGQNEAEIVTEFTGADGLEYVSRFSQEKDKDEKFVLTLPDGSKERKVTEIRKIIGYNQITIDEWFRLGLTAEGRRKQADYLMELIPNTDKAKIAKIDEEINSKTGISYLRRQAKNKDLEASQGVINRLKISEAEIQSLKDLPKLQEGLAKLEAEEKQASEHNAKISSLITIQQQQEQNKVRLEKEITDTEAEIKRLQERLVIAKAEHEKIINTPIQDAKPIDTTILVERISKGKTMIENIKSIQERQNTLKLESSRAKQLSDEVEEYDKKIKTLREERQAIIANANLSDKIMLDSDGCWFVDDSGELLPFNEDNISYSVGGIEVARLILEKNKSLPLVVLGKASEYDAASLEKLAHLATKYNGIILADQVIPDGELSIEIYQSNKD